MPYATIENMYTSLTTEKQREVYDFLCFLVAQTNGTQSAQPSPIESYSEGFFDLFGSCTDETFVEPQDFVATINEDELF